MVNSLKFNLKAYPDLEHSLNSITQGICSLIVHRNKIWNFFPFLENTVTCFDEKND
jgi:hypothetical protein